MPGGGAQTKLRPWIRGPRAPAFLTGLKEDAPPSRPRSAPGPSLPLAGELTARSGQPLSRSFRQAPLGVPGRLATGGWTLGRKPAAPRRPPTRGTPSFQRKCPSRGLDSECPPELWASGSHSKPQARMVCWVTNNIHIPPRDLKNPPILREL